MRPMVGWQMMQPGRMRENMTRTNGDRLVQRLAAAIAQDDLVGPDIHAVPDIASAYAIQLSVFERRRRPLRGFKLTLRDGIAFSAPLLCVGSSGPYQFVPGTVVEVELALTLRRDLAPRLTPYSRDEIVDAIGPVSLGIELARSRFPVGAAFPLALADCLSNVGYTVGPELHRDVLAPGADPGIVSVKAGDTVLFDAPAAHPDGDPLASLVAYANRQPSPLGPLTAGHVVTTGSMCGGLQISQPTILHVALGWKQHSLVLIS